MENVDYSLYPDRDYQLKWLRMYLELKAVHRGSDSSTVIDRDVEVLYVQVNKFALVGINRCNKLDNVYKFALVDRIYIKSRRSRYLLFTWFICLFVYLFVC